MSKRTLPDPLTNDERAALLKIPNRRYLTGLRNLAMIQLMLNIGLRSAELLSVQINDVDLNTGKVMVRKGKGAKDRVVWLNAESLALLQEWRERRRTQSEYYFTTLQGKRLATRYLRAMMARYARRAGISRRCSPHTLRHTFATDLLRQTGNIEMVKKALGHAWLSTTGIYLHVVDSELESAMRGFRQ